MNDLVTFIGFTDGIERAVWQFRGRQYIVNDEGEPVYGVWHVEPEETPSPIIVIAKEP